MKRRRSRRVNPKRLSGKFQKQSSWRGGRSGPCWRNSLQIRGAGFEKSKLAARGHDVLAARIANEDPVVFLEKNALKIFDADGIGTVVGQVAGIPGDQVYFGAKAGEKRGDATRVLGRIIKATEEDVLEGEVFPGAQRVAAAGVEKGSEGIFAIDGHDHVALIII